jgi:hypothetical protein
MPKNPILENPQVKTILDHIDKKFDIVDQRLNSADKKSNTNRRYMEYKFDLIDKRLAKIDRRLDVIPTTKQFLSEMDKFFTQQKRNDEEQLFLKHQVSRNSDDIVDLQRHLHLQPAQ